MYLITLQLSRYTDLQYIATGKFTHPFSHRTLGTFVDTIKDLVTEYKPIIGYTSMGYCYLLLKNKPKPENIDVMSSFASVRFNSHLKKNMQRWNGYDLAVDFSKFLNNVYFTAKLYETTDPKNVFFELMNKTKEEADRITSFVKSDFKILPCFRIGVFSKLAKVEHIISQDNYNGTHKLETTYHEKGVILKLNENQIKNQMNKLLKENFLESSYILKYSALLA